MQSIYNLSKVFHNCTCVSEVLLPAANMSAVLGQCPRRADCNFMFKLYMAVSVLGAFVSACGGTPGYIVLLRSIQPDLKSLALGMQTLIVRTLESVTISPKDARWVGAWWMGFFISAALLILSGIPFWFLPRSVSEQEPEAEGSPTPTPPELDNSHTPCDRDVKPAEVTKGFRESLKQLLGTPAYLLLLCAGVLRFNSLIGLFTFMAKYIEQQFGQSASRANFVIGVLTLPVLALGIFLGGLLMKRYKLSVVSGALLSFVTSFVAFLLFLLIYLGTKCDHVPMAGLTVSYN
ncbi:hypothetical protein CRUP_016837, partial [Coryphaenoides rupestris]